MKILHFNHHLPVGGAARAALRLSDALNRVGVESRVRSIVVNGSVMADCGPSSRLLRSYGMMASAPSGLLMKLRGITLRGQYSPPAMFNFPGLIREINNSDFDLIHLHWVAAGMFADNVLRRICKPVVWSLHDMHPFTGGCHYDNGCGRFVTGCGSCPMIGGNGPDLSSRSVAVKSASAQSNRRHTIVGLSQWMADAARKSQVFRNSRVECLPNPIDTTEFRPVDRGFARNLFDLPSGKFLVLFGAMNANSDPRKGYHFIQQALSEDRTVRFDLVMFGAGSRSRFQIGDSIVHNIGMLNDDSSLRALYSACDVFLAPSAQENLSNAIMEALSCGLPVVAFRVGGNPDLIDHGCNGYLAEAYSIKDMLAGLEWALNNNVMDGLRQKAREKVINFFSEDIVVKKYIALYQSMT